MIKLAGIGHVLLRVADEEASKRFYRDVRLFRLYEGTSQIQQLIIARNMLKRAKR